VIVLVRRVPVNVRVRMFDFPMAVPVRVDEIAILKQRVILQNLARSSAGNHASLLHHVRDGCNLFHQFKLMGCGDYRP